MTEHAREPAGSAAIVDAVLDVNRTLALIGAHLLDVSVPLIVADTRNSTDGGPSLVGALNALHSAQDEILGAQRVLMRILELVRTQAEARA